MYNFQNALQTHTPNAGFTWRLYSVHNAPTTRPRRSRRLHSVPTARCLTRCANAKPPRLFGACPKQTMPHGVLGAHTARKQRCWRLHSAHLDNLLFLDRCGNAVMTPLWCDRGLSFNKLFNHASFIVKRLYNTM